MAIVNGYATNAQVRAALQASGTAIPDSLLDVAIESASRRIDEHCGRRFFTNGTESRYYAADDFCELWIDDVAGATLTLQTSTSANGTWDVTWATTDYQTEPLNRDRGGITYPITCLRAVGGYRFPVWYGRSTVKVQAVFGFATTVPVGVTEAAILLAERHYKRFESPTGILGFGDMGVVRVGRIPDPDVTALLAPYALLTSGPQ